MMTALPPPNPADWRPHPWPRSGSAICDAMTDRLAIALRSIVEAMLR